jgi:Uma2 family endonuclease
MTGAGAPRHRYTFRDYLDLEESSATKHEFFAGEIYAMAGGTPEHAALAAEVIAALRPQLRGKPCRVYTSDLRLRVLATGLATYRDVTVVCGPLERDPESPSTAINPKVVVEVLSDRTEDYDRGDKLDHYRQIPALEACVLVSQREQLLEKWQRQPDTQDWTRREARAGGKLAIGPIACTLDVRELYRGSLGDDAPPV